MAVGAEDRPPPSSPTRKREVDATSCPFPLGRIRSNIHIRCYSVQCLTRRGQHGPEKPPRTGDPAATAPDTQVRAARSPRTLHARHHRHRPGDSPLTEKEGNRHARTSPRETSLRSQNAERLSSTARTWLLQSQSPCCAPGHGEEAGGREQTGHTESP